MKKPETPREMALYRVAVNCKIGRDALDKHQDDDLRYAVYCLLHAVESLGEAMAEGNT